MTGTASPLTTVIILRRNLRDLHVLSQALECAFPQQLDILHATRHAELVRLLSHHEVDVVITEFRGLAASRRRTMDSEGLPFLRYLSRRRHRPVESLVLLSEVDAHLGEECLQAGATAYAMESEVIEAAVEILMMASLNKRPLEMEVREMCLSDTAGEAIYALNCPDPESRAFLCALLHSQVRRMSHALGTDGFEGLFMQGPSFEAMFDTRHGMGLFVGAAPEASQFEMGAPPPGSTLEESLEVHPILEGGAPSTWDLRRPAAQPRPGEDRARGGELPDERHGGPDSHCSRILV